MFRKIDGLAEEIQRSQPPVNMWRKFIYCTSLSGSILGSVDHMHPQGAIDLQCFDMYTHKAIFLGIFLLSKLVFLVGL